MFCFLNNKPIFQKFYVYMNIIPFLWLSLVKIYITSIFFSKMFYHVFSTKINPRGASIHRINDLDSLKPPLENLWISKEIACSKAMWRLLKFKTYFHSRHPWTINVSLSVITTILKKRVFLTFTIVQTNSACHIFFCCLGTGYRNILPCCKIGPWPKEKRGVKSVPHAV